MSRSKYNDLTGQRFGLWIVLGRAYHARGHGSMWNCRCDCGNSGIVSLSNLRGGLSTGCGCARRESNQRRMSKHGDSCSPTYTVWMNMKIRCYNPSARGYKDYGGRGIKVCRRWRNSYKNFVTDLGVRPGPRYTIERKKVNGNYTPGNCCWILRKFQGDNKRNSRSITYLGETKSITAWARQYGLKSGALYFRLVTKKMPFSEAVLKPLEKRRIIIQYKGEDFTVARLAKLTGLPHKSIADRAVRGWSASRIVSTPLRDQARLIAFRGETLTLTEWSRKLCIDDATISYRLKIGWSVEKSLTTPSKKNPDRIRRRG